MIHQFAGGIVGVDVRTVISTSDINRVVQEALTFGRLYGYVGLSPIYTATSLAWADAYAAGTTYALGDVVTSGNVVYRSLQAANVGHAPAASPTWWTAMADDWARKAAVEVVCAANDWNLVCLPGIWTCQSKQVVPTRLREWGYGATCVSALAPNAPPSNEDATPFYNANYAAAGNTVTTLASNATQFARTIVVTSADGFAIGKRLWLRDTAKARLHSFEIRAIAGTTITLDARLPYAFPSATTEVEVLATANKLDRVHIEGWTIVGTGDKAIELVCAWNSTAANNVIDSRGFELFALAFDVGGRNNLILHHNGDGNSDLAGAAGDACVALEYNIGSCVHGGHFRRAKDYANILITGNDGWTVEDVHCDGGKVGLLVTTNATADTWGSFEGSVCNSEFHGCTEAGIEFVRGSHDNDVVACSFDSCTIGVYQDIGGGGAATNNAIHGGSALSCGYSVECAGGGQLDVWGLRSKDATSGHAYVTGGGKLRVHGGKFLDSTTAGFLAADIAHAMFQCASSTLEIDGWAHVESEKTAAGNLFCVALTGTAVCRTNGVRVVRPGVSPTVSAWLQDTAKMYLDNWQQSGGSNGCYCSAAANIVWLGSNVEIAGTTTPLFSQISNNYSKVLAPLVGGTATITLPMCAATSRVRVSRGAAGGTLGDLSVAPGAGSAVVTSTNALDTSTVLVEVLPIGGAI